MLPIRRLLTRHVTALRACAVVLVLLPAPGRAEAHPALDEQIADLSARIGRRPADASLYLRRGDLYKDQGDWRRAGADYRQARIIDPTLAVVDLHVGALLLEEGRPAPARAALDRYLARRPDDPRGLRLRARAHRALGAPLAAASDLGRVVAAIVPPQRPEPDDYLARAQALAAAGPGHIGEAIAVLDEGMAAMGPIVSLQVPAVDLDIQTGRFDEALRRVDALEGATGLAEVWRARRGEILERAGRGAESREAYAAALRAIEARPPEARRSPALQAIEIQVRTALRRMAGARDATQGGQ